MKNACLIDQTNSRRLKRFTLLTSPKDGLEECLVPDPGNLPIKIDEPHKSLLVKEVDLQCPDNKRELNPLRLVTLVRLIFLICLKKCYMLQKLKQF